MKTSLGQPVVIENVGGAGGTIGDGAGRALGAGRLHLGFGQMELARRSAARSTRCIRSAQGLEPVALLTMARLWIIGRKALAGEGSQGTDRLAQGQSGQGDGGNDRRRQRRAALLHLLPEQHRNQVPARAVSRRGAGDAGSARRADRPDLSRGRADAGALSQRQDQGLRGDGHDALVRGARCADHRRGRACRGCT